MATPARPVAQKSLGGIAGLRSRERAVACSIGRSTPETIWSPRATRHTGSPAEGPCHQARVTRGQPRRAAGLGSLTSRLSAADRLPGCLAVPRALLAGCSGDAYRLGAGGWHVEVVEVGFGHGPVEADRLVGHRERQGYGVVGLDEAEFAGGDRDAGLAAAVDGVDGGGFGG